MLLKWANLLDFESFWELKSTIQQAFTISTLGTRWIFKKGGIVRNPIFGNLYACKKKGSGGPLPGPYGEKTTNERVVSVSRKARVRTDFVS